MAHDVFISYSSKDKAIADAVCSKLEDHKIRCWIAPRDVPPGVNFAGSIIDAIDTCKLFILIWSANTNTSDHILNELNQAFDQGISVIPFRIENVEPSKALKYYIGRTHWLDALTPPLEKHIKLLADTILTNLGRQAEIKPDIPIVKEKEVREEKKKEEDKKLASKPSSKPRAWWPYLTGLLIMAVVVVAYPLLKQPVQPISKPSTNTPMTMGTSNQPTNTPMETVIAVPLSTPIQPTQTPIHPKEPKVEYQTQDLGTPDYQSSFTRASFDAFEWPVRDSKGAILSHGEDDTYRFDIQPPSSQITALYLDGKKGFANSIVEVEVKFLENGGEVGIVCRTSFSNNGGYKGYRAKFNINGRTSISLSAPPKTNILTVDGAMKTTGIYYRLRFDCIGQTLTVFENGEKIGEVQDNTYYVGSPGLFVNPNDSFQVAFDNFKLWLP